MKRGNSADYVELFYLLSFGLKTLSSRRGLFIQEIIGPIQCMPSNVHILRSNYFLLTWLNLELHLQAANKSAEARERRERHSCSPEFLIHIILLEVIVDCWWWKWSSQSLLIMFLWPFLCSCEINCITRFASCFFYWVLGSQRKRPRVGLLLVQLKQQLLTWIVPDKLQLDIIWINNAYIIVNLKL